MKPELPEPRGSVRPTGPAVPVILGCVGLVTGWSLRPLSLRFDTTVPEVTWTQVGVLGFLVGVIGITAWATWRQLQQDRGWLEPWQAVNRLLMAKACTVVGACLAGGFSGYAVSWVGVDSEVSGARMLHAGVAALASVALVAVSLWLERACRTKDDEPPA